MLTVFITHNWEMGICPITIMKDSPELCIFLSADPLLLMLLEHVVWPENVKIIST